MILKKAVIASLIVAGLLGCQSQKPISNPRIAIAGLAIECSTFSPAETHVEDFRARRGQEIFFTTHFYI
ncbi:MAG: M81 family metallopeptidase [Bacteroidales bacterium]|nr:M81 family metallopeptidase [Bacteroidales bacterium]